MTNVCELIYRPLQPDYERQGGYKSYIVQEDDPLYGIVLMYYEFSNVTQAEEMILKALPDAIIDIVFKCYQDMVDVHIGAGTGKYYEIKYEKVEHLFGLQLAPGAVNMLFPFKAENVVQAGRINLSEMIEFHLLREKFKKTGCFEERIVIVSKILEEIFDVRLECYDTIQSSVREMMGHLCEFKVEDVAREVGYSIRYFRKIFKENVGYSPQKFMRIVRFQKSYEAIVRNSKKQSLTEISVEYGYYDQSHMNKEYLFLVNRLPHELRSGVI